MFQLGLVWIVWSKSSAFKYIQHNSTWINLLKKGIHRSKLVMSSIWILDMLLVKKKKRTQTIAYKKVKWHFTGNNSWPSAMVCDLARLFSDNMAILNYQFGGIFAAFFAFRSNSSHSGVASPCTGFKWLWICSICSSRLIWGQSSENF